MNKKINAKLDEKNNMVILDNDEYLFYYKKFSNYIKKIYDIDINSYINTKYYSSSCRQKLYSGADHKYNKWQLGFILDSNGDSDIPFTLIICHFIFNYDNDQFNLLNIKIDALAIKTVNKLPIDDIKFYTHIHFDDKMDMIGYNVSDRIIIDGDDDSSYIVIDIEYIINDIQIDYIMDFNNHLKESDPEQYKIINKNNVNDLDILINSKFIEMFKYIKNPYFEDIFGLKRSCFCNVDSTLIIYNDFVKNFDLNKFNKNIQLFKILNI